MKRIAIFCMLAFVCGFFAGHLRIKAADNLRSICYYWSMPTFTPSREPDLGPALYEKTDGQRYVDLRKQTPEVSTSPITLTSGSTSNLAFVEVRSSQVVLNVTSTVSGGKAELYGNDGQLLATLHRDGFVDYYADRNKVVHSLADLVCVISSAKYKRWTDAIVEVPREDQK